MTSEEALDNIISTMDYYEQGQIDDESYHIVSRNLDILESLKPFFVKSTDILGNKYVYIDITSSALGRKKEKQLLEYLDWIDESRNKKENKNGN